MAIELAIIRKIIGDGLTEYFVDYRKYMSEIRAMVLSSIVIFISDQT
jgi:hypothetical protein